MKHKLATIDSIYKAYVNAGENSYQILTIPLKM